MKKLVGILIALVLACLGMSVGTYMLVDQKAVRDHVTHAFYEQSGLELHMDTTSFQVFPWPSFHASNVVLTRSGCTPFVTARSVHADISLLALLHREISFQDFTVGNAHIMFHRTREGACSSWLPFKTEGHVEQPIPSSHASVQTPHARWKVSFDALHLTNAQLSWQDERHVHGDGDSGGFTISSLDLQGMRSISPWIDLRAQHGETPFAFKGRMGPSHRVLSVSARQEVPWDFSLGLTFGAEGHQDQMVMDGSFMDPHRLRGLRLSLQGHWADLRDFEGLFPHIGLPDVKMVNGVIDLRERDEAQDPQEKGFAERLRALSGRLYPVQMHVQLGSVDFPQGTLGIEAPLHFRQMQLDADDSLAPLSVRGDADWGRFSWLFQAKMGTLEKSVAAWFEPQRPTVPLDVTLQGRDRTLASLLSHQDQKAMAEQDGVHFHAQGVLGRQSSQLSFDGHADMLQVPELPGMETSLSGAIVHALTVNGQLETGRFSAHGLDKIDVHDLHFESRDVGGDGRFSITRVGDHSPSSIDAFLHLSHANGDALISSAAPASSEEKAPSPSPEAAHVQTDRLQAMMSPLGTHHVTLALAADQLSFYGMDYRDVQVRMMLGGNHLLLTPMKATVGGVSLSARVDVDNTVHPARFRFEASPWMMPSAQLFQLIGQEPIFDGPVQLDGALEAHGDTQQALVQSLEGAMGLSIVKGQIHTSVLAPLAGPAAAFLKLGDGTMNLRCAAVHMDVHQGQGQIDTLGAQTKHFIVRGHGQVGLHDGSLALQLMPHVSLAGNEFSMPVRIEGSIVSPQVTQLHKDDGQNQLDIGQDAGSADPCQELIQKARGGHDGLPIPAMSGEHSRTGDILKALGIGGKP